jgi:outer membrane protein assembly factor BamB
LTICLLAALSGARVGTAENWPGWRGPEAGGVSGEAKLPERWSASSGIRWRVGVPGEGFSSPIVWRDRVFVTTAFEGGTRRAVCCLNRTNGKTLWMQSIRHDWPEITSAMTGHAAATPVTDGDRIVAVFGNAGAVCYAMDGRQLWRHDLGRFDSELGLASSPVMHGDLVILVCDHDGDRFTSFDSYLIALDKRTGAVRWKTERPKVYRSWSTPLLVELPRRAGEPRIAELIVGAQDELRSYDPCTGKPLWRVTGMTDWVAPSPVFAGGLIYATSGKDGPTLAVRPGGRGDASDKSVAWKQAHGGPYVCSPLVYGDYLYVHNEQGVLNCYQAATGKPVYRERLPGRYTASAVAGDGKLYFTNEDGETQVVKAGPRFERIGRNSLGEYCLASPAVSHGQLFVRTEHFLYCIEGSDATEGNSK